MINGPSKVRWTDKALNTKENYFKITKGNSIYYILDGTVIVIEKKLSAKTINKQSFDKKITDISKIMTLDIGTVQIKVDEKIHQVPYLICGYTKQIVKKKKKNQIYFVLSKTQVITLHPKQSKNF